MVACHGMLIFPLFLSFLQLFKSKNICIMPVCSCHEKHASSDLIPLNHYIPGPDREEEDYYYEHILCLAASLQAFIGGHIHLRTFFYLPLFYYKARPVRGGILGSLYGLRTGIGWSTNSTLPLLPSMPPTLTLFPSDLISFTYYLYGVF